MNEDAPAIRPAMRPAIGQPGIRWSGDGALGGGAEHQETAAPSNAVPASVRLRAAGFIIDSLVLLGVAVMLSTAIVLAAGIDSTASQEEVQREVEQLYPMLYLVEGTLQFIYNLVWNAIGWSPGKRMLRMRTVDAGGNPPGLRRGVARTLGSVLSGSFFGLGYAWAIWDREHRTWHDHIAKTYVVKLPDEAPYEQRR